MEEPATPRNPCLSTPGTWESIEGASDRAGPVTWGCDLGTVCRHESAIAAFWPETGRLESVAAFLT